MSKRSRLWLAEASCLALGVACVAVYVTEGVRHEFQLADASTALTAVRTMASRITIATSTSAALPRQVEVDPSGGEAAR